PGPVDAGSEGSVDDELHPAALVEEALEDDPGLRRHAPESRAAGEDELPDLERGPSGQGEPAFVLESRSRGVGIVRPGDVLAETPDRAGELASAARGLAQPEGEAGRLALRIRDPDDSRLHLKDAPRGVSELEDVAAVGLDGPVLVDGADDRPFGL